MHFDNKLNNNVVMHVRIEKEKMEKQNTQKKEIWRFCGLLNQLRRKNKISAVERRNYEKNWRARSGNKDLLREELEHIASMREKNPRLDF
jgi:hypothetical protein